MIAGIGIDVTSIPRIQRAVDRYGDRFMTRVLTGDERQDVSGRQDRDAAVAARFAAKEAAFKALGGPPDVWWHDIELVRPSGQAPRLLLHGPAQRRAQMLGVTKAHVSLTHDAGVAVAMVVLERADD